MNKILAKELKAKFAEGFANSDRFSCDKGNPFFIKIGTKRFFVFLKNISSAYFSNLPDITRVQLPYSEHFANIVNANVTFIVLGYDAESDTFVSWDPKSIQERLNARGNVSLYSRKSLQIQSGREFRSGSLSNGDKIVIFPRQLLPQFFGKVSDLFSKGTTSDTSLPPTIRSGYETDKLYEINDRKLLSKMKPLLKKNRVLQAVAVCAKHYADKYKSMGFKDWFKLVDNVYRNTNGMVAAEPPATHPYTVDATRRSYAGSEHSRVSEGTRERFYGLADSIYNLLKTDCCSKAAGWRLHKSKRFVQAVFSCWKTNYEGFSLYYEPETGKQYLATNCLPKHNRLISISLTENKKKIENALGKNLRWNISTWEGVSEYVGSNPLEIANRIKAYIHTLKPYLDEVLPLSNKSRKFLSQSKNSAH